MAKETKWLDMLAGYGSHHQDMRNVICHLIGVPFIMLGMFIPMSWVGMDVAGFNVHLALLAVVGLTLFYLTLDWVSAMTFAVISTGIMLLAQKIGADLSTGLAWLVSAVGFFGGYALQFWGHAIEGRKPYLLDYPIQANVSAPLFVVVEAYKLLGMREEMFDAMHQRIQELDAAKA